MSGFIFEGKGTKEFFFSSDKIVKKLRHIMQELVLKDVQIKGCSSCDKSRGFMSQN